MSKLIFSFLKDRFYFIVGFILNSLLLILFFYLTSNKSIEIIYPLIISFFTLVLLLSIEWFRFFPFHKHLSKSIDNMYYDLDPLTEEQKTVANIITEIHHRCNQELQENTYRINEKESFFSHWVHNVKTPVSVIDLIIQKCKENEVSMSEGIDSIQQENIRIHHTLEQVLNILRLEDFSKDYIPETINLNEEIKKVINSKRNQFIYNNVFPKLEEIDEEVIVLSDAKWNQHMLDQIISNAIKYSASKKKSKNIYFSIEKNLNNTNLSIRDEGVGIPEYDMNKIFEPFFTGENGRKFKESTGIGLYISAMIAEKLGQDIAIKSKVGHGTVVTITYLTKM